MTALPIGSAVFSVRSAGTTSDGGVESTTVTKKLSVAGGLPATEAVHVTVVSPSGNVVPLSASHCTAIVRPCASIAVTSKTATAPEVPVASTSTPCGGTRIVTGGGGLQSAPMTVTAALQLFVAPRSSVTVSVTGVVPMV